MTPKDADDYAATVAKMTEPITTFRCRRCDELYAAEEDSVAADLKLCLVCFKTRAKEALTLSKNGATT